MASSPERPHGIQYSLTMHDAQNQRLVGFDNAHGYLIKPTRGGVVRATDHWHKLGRVKPYRYESAAKLVTDFWEAVDHVLKLRGKNQ